MNREQILKMSKYEDEILDLVDNRDEFTRSDLQGIVSALVAKIVQEAAKGNVGKA